MDNEGDKEAPNLEKLAAALNLEIMAAAPPNLEKMAATLILQISLSTLWTRPTRFTLRLPLSLTLPQPFQQSCSIPFQHA